MIKYFTKLARKWALSSSIRRRNRVVEACTLASARNIVVVLDMPMDKHVAEAKQILEEKLPKSAIVDYIAFNTFKSKDDSVEEETLSWCRSYYNNELNWAQRPNNHQLVSDVAKKYDLLIDLSNFTYMSQLFILSSRAKFKVSTGIGDGYVDLIINGTSKDKLNKADFIRQLINYMPIFQKNKDNSMP